MPFGFLECRPGWLGAGKPPDCWGTALEGHTCSGSGARAAAMDHTTPATIPPHYDGQVNLSSLSSCVRYFGTVWRMMGALGFLLLPPRLLEACCRASLPGQTFSWNYLENHWRHNQV